LPKNRVPIPYVLDRSTSGRRSVPLGGQQGAEALVLLPAGQAARQGGGEPGQLDVGVLAGQLGEAVVAAAPAPRARAARPPDSSPGPLLPASRPAAGRWGLAPRGRERPF